MGLDPIFQEDIEGIFLSCNHFVLKKNSRVTSSACMHNLILDTPRFLVTSCANQTNIFTNNFTCVLKTWLMLSRGISTMGAHFAR